MLHNLNDIEIFQETTLSVSWFGKNDLELNLHL
jgi:hypothetical protein